MPQVTIAPADDSEKDTFGQHFQDYLGELAVFNGAKPNKAGLFEYNTFDLYWRAQRFMPFFIQCGDRRAGLLMLRELPKDESPRGTESLQVAEICVFKPHRRRSIAKQTMRIAARIAEERCIPLTWTAYMNNRAANALYDSLLQEFKKESTGWSTEQWRGIDRCSVARFYYYMTPATARAE